MEVESLAPKGPRTKCFRKTQHSHLNQGQEGVGEMASSIPSSLNGTALNGFPHIRLDRPEQREPLIQLDSELLQSIMESEVDKEEVMDASYMCVDKKKKHRSDCGCVWRMRAESRSLTTDRQGGNRSSAAKHGLSETRIAAVAGV
jgi:hypothetical protein